ncbi:MAG: prepilin-type N-terminal cleavage/methylation domain-containing protein [Sedimentisphaerales bacterium]|nr:prepilin-type N-terminal cleavage/methylation domain-containing protein [Sedimentisphaerales bacterium]
MTKSRGTHIRAFSLLELVIAVAIIAIIAAIGIPRLSRGTQGAADSALSGNLSLLRNAIDIYAAEHGGTYPTVADCNDQLTQYSNTTGTTSATKTTTYIYGPYVRSIPPLPVGAKKGKTGIAGADGTNVGWIYSATDGSIKANTTDSELDEAGKKYNEY